MRRLLVASDLSERSRPALSRAIAMARDPEVQLTVVHVVESGADEPVGDPQERTARDALRRQVEEALSRDLATDENIDIQVRRGRAFAEVLRLAGERRAELILLGTHRRGPFDSVFLGSTVDRVLRVGLVPALVVKSDGQQAYERVLVGIDFSPASRHAVDAALALAADHAEVRLVHAYETALPALAKAFSSYGEDYYQHVFETQAEADFAAFAGTLASDHRYRRLVRQGPPIDVLTEEARRMDADLIALGTHGRTWLEGTFLGSTTSALMRSAGCDVLGVRGPFSLGSGTEGE